MLVAAAAALALLPQAELEQAQPLCRTVKRGAWVPLQVTVRAAAPFEGEIVARTDAAPLFVARVRFPSAGVQRLWLPVYWIGARGGATVHLHGAPAEILIRDVLPVQPQDLIVAATPASGLDEREESRGPQSLYVVRVDELPEGVMLESIDAIAGPGPDGDDPALASFRMRGGRAIGDEPPRIEALAPQSFVPAAEPRERGSRERPLVSEIRAGRATALLLLFGVVACAALLLLGLKSVPVRRSIPAAAGVALFFAALAALWIPAEAVVVRAVAAESAGGRMVLFDVTCSSNRTHSLELEGLAKPLFDAPCRIVYDPAARRTRVEALNLRAHEPLSFVSFQDFAPPSRLSIEGGSRVRNGEADAAGGVFLMDGRVRGRVEVEPGGSADVVESPPTVLDAIERLIVKGTCQSGAALLVRLRETPAAPWREGADVFVERRAEPRYVVLR
jgi:hypothetical protein